MSKEAIVERIIADAQAEAAAALADAEARAEAILEEAKRSSAEFAAAEKKRAATAAAETVARSRTVAELDAGKIMLGAKSSLIDEVFASALKMAGELDAATCKKIVLGMLDFAKDGDEITVSARESKIVTKKLVDEVAKKKGIKLTLAGIGDFDGGLIIAKDGEEKNFTYKVEFELLRDELEAAVAKKLFG